MIEVHDTYKSIYQNLIDAGCDESITDKEIVHLEKLGDETGVHTLREWEKEV